MNIRGVTKIITSDAIRHIIKTHGTEDEKKRGQKPISYSDIELIPRIVANFDQVEKGREKHGQSVVFTKNIDGVDYSVAMKYFNNGGNAKLEVRTMFAK